MLIPIRCTSCGMPLDDVGLAFCRMRAALVAREMGGRDTAPECANIDSGLQVQCAPIFESLGVKSYCCRMLLMTVVDFREFTGWD